MKRKCFSGKSGCTLLLLFLLCPLMVFAQGIVTYGVKVNGKEIHRGRPLRLSYKNGHTVSLKLNYYRRGDNEDTPEKPWLLPFFNTLNILEMSGQNYGRLFGNDSLKVRVFVPGNIRHLTLRYISTGHGGRDGGDEFNPKVNTLLINGRKVLSYTPWRTDCSIYRLGNPSSGNSGSGLSSSDYSRSGWCPGTTTNPVYIPLPHLKPGWHTFAVAIPEGKQAGSSFSFWNVSGCLTGTVKP